MSNPATLFNDAPLPDIKAQIIHIMTDPEHKSTGSKRNRIAQTVVQILTARGKFFFHREYRDFETAMYFDGERKRLERIRSDSFTAWLSEWLAVNRADQLFRFILSEVETYALSGEKTEEMVPEAFWAARSGAIYLSTGDGRMAKITGDQIRIVDNGTDGVLFAAGRTLLPWSLTDPADPFATCSLFSDIRCTASSGPNLIKLWSIGLATNPRSKPPLCLAGDVGSGKTRLAKGLAELYGFPFVACKVEENGERDFWPGMDQGGLFILDNADTRTTWLADALANAATDGCSQHRKLYSNSEVVLLRARAWIAITTCNPTFAGDAGLADRLLVARMARRSGETSDAKLTDEILANRDAGLSFIAQTLQKALADTGPVPSGLNYRHPDWASFAVRIGRALGKENEAIAALRSAEEDKAHFCVENDPVGSALLILLQSGQSFDGTAKELLDKLINVDPELSDRTSAKTVGRRLNALWPHIARVCPGSRKGHDRTGVTRFTFSAGREAENARA